MNTSEPAKFAANAINSMEKNGAAANPVEWQGVTGATESGYYVVLGADTRLLANHGRTGWRIIIKHFDRGHLVNATEVFEFAGSPLVDTIQEAMDIDEQQKQSNVR